MSEIVTKVKINIKEGTIELEGSESFVTKCLEDFREKISNRILQQVPEKLEFNSDNNKKENSSKVKPSKKKGISISPVPLDLKSHEPKLRDFYNNKKPSTNQEKITLFTYYINKILKINNVQAGHIVSSYQEVNDRVPLNIPQMFKDVSHRKSWLESTGESSCVKTTIAGDNLIEHDLPKKLDK